MYCLRSVRMLLACGPNSSTRRVSVPHAAGGRQRGVAVAGGHVEHLVTRPQVHGFAQRFADDLEQDADAA
ncbi:MAG: hypothetical protein A2W00_04950 [Candidatus Eisenbacteria bacterium RBG_16_71_46]|nr:MAG: hypothetical protein A2W00_04950 [Candidatus Eisenbacteria bacterium RBG_16_71_46]